MMSCCWLGRYCAVPDPDRGDLHHLYRWMRSPSRPHQKGSAEFQKGWDGCYQISSSAQQAQDSKEGEFHILWGGNHIPEYIFWSCFPSCFRAAPHHMRWESQNLHCCCPRGTSSPTSLAGCAHQWCAFVLARRQAHQLLPGHLRWVQSEGSLWCDSWLRSYDGSLHHQRCSLPRAVPEPWAHAVVAGSGGQSCLWAHFDPRFHLAFWRAGKICKAVFCRCVAELNPSRCQCWRRTCGTWERWGMISCPRVASLAAAAAQFLTKL